MTNEKAKISEKIKQAAFSVGFDGCGISKAEFLKEDAGFLKEWLEKGMHDEMQYMENHFEKRINPAILVEETKSVISVFLNYFPETFQTKKDVPIISKYAYGEDYHFVMKKMLGDLFEKINKEITPVKVRVFVDSAPVLERALARKAGLGWIGKNSNIIHPEFGSFIFLGELFIDIELNYDKPIENKCGNCTKCLDSCPTQALVKPYILDSRKCISCLTIEHKSALPLQLAEKFGKMVFGCDICQDVCPYNKNARPNTIAKFKPKEELLKMTKEDWYGMDEGEFLELFKKSAVKRTKFAGMRRNLDFIRSNFF